MGKVFLFINNALILRVNPNIFDLSLYFFGESLNLNGDMDNKYL
jgi:hypothetical protein